MWWRPSISLWQLWWRRLTIVWNLRHRTRLVEVWSVVWQKQSTALSPCAIYNYNYGSFDLITYIIRWLDTFISNRYSPSIYNPKVCQKSFIRVKNVAKQLPEVLPANGERYTILREPTTWFLFFTFPIIQTPQIRIIKNCMINGTFVLPRQEF